MKKVGIMSMQRIVNYGSFMQAYGLKSIIEELGYKVEFVDYTIEPCVNGNKLKKINQLTICKKLKKGLKRFLKRYESPVERANNELIERYNTEFLPILGISKKMYYRTKVDTLVIGSDEVFNCLQDNPNVGYSRELFGYMNKANRVITYAASFGNTTLKRLQEYKKTDEVSQYLKQMKKISVRDKNSFHIVKELVGQTPVCNMDPVLMYDFSKEMEGKVVKEKNYIIVYAYSGRIKPEEAALIQEYAREKGKKLISISGYQDFCDEHLVLSPFEVLAYFKNADYIITDTFHGSIFSIINNKDFAVIIRKSQGDSYGNEEKISDLLSKLNLSDRVLNSINDIKEKFSIAIDYTETNKIIDEQRLLARNYLRDNLL